MHVYIQKNFYAEFNPFPPIQLRLYTLSYWSKSNPQFLIFAIWALCVCALCSLLSARMSTSSSAMAERLHKLD